MNQFDAIAEQYDHVFPKHISDHYFTKRILFLSQLIKNGLVLDLCSGTGRISEGLIQKGYRVISLDMSMQMLMVRKNLKGYCPVSGLADELPFRSGIFDMAVSIASFHHIAEKDRVKRTINEMKRIIKKGGFVVIWDHNPLNPYWKIVMNKAPQDTGEERLISASEILSAFNQSDYSCKILKKGFMPDFAPERLMFVFRFIESVIETLPALKFFTAHNVIVAKKL